MAVSKGTTLVSAAEALPSRSAPMVFAPLHYVNGRTLVAPFPEGLEIVLFGLGCFWGAERLFWRMPGIFSTAVGYAGGHTGNPTYQDVCTGRTAHTEVVHVVYDPAVIAFAKLLKAFWEQHDPTQGMRQGNDVGTQYRSAIYTTTPAQFTAALATRNAYQAELVNAGEGNITTEIRADVRFFYAEDYHQQYLAKNPNGYCGLQGTGVPCPA
jgi:peptide-methionine (S)-S-oxide reductase